MHSKLPPICEPSSLTVPIALRPLRKTLPLIVALSTESASPPFPSIRALMQSRLPLIFALIRRISPLASNFWRRSTLPLITARSAHIALPPSPSICAPLQSRSPLIYAPGRRTVPMALKPSRRNTSPLTAAPSPWMPGTWDSCKKTVPGKLLRRSSKGSEKVHALQLIPDTVVLSSRLSVLLTHAPDICGPCSCTAARSSPPSNKKRKKSARTVFCSVASSGRLSLISATSPRAVASSNFRSAGNNGSKSLNDLPYARAGVCAFFLGLRRTGFAGA